MAKGKNSLIFALGTSHSEITRLIESLGLEAYEIDLRVEGRRFLKILYRWEETSENTVYLAHDISSQFPWILVYINLHRDLLYDIKRPVVMIVSLYEIITIQKNAPDFYRFRSRTYDFSDEEAGSSPELLRLGRNSHAAKAGYLASKNPEMDDPG